MTTQCVALLRSDLDLSALSKLIIGVMVNVKRGFAPFLSTVQWRYITICVFVDPIAPCRIVYC